MYAGAGREQSSREKEEEHEFGPLSMEPTAKRDFAIDRERRPRGDVRDISGRAVTVRYGDG